MVQLAIANPEHLFVSEDRYGQAAVALNAKSIKEHLRTTHPTLAGKKLKAKVDEILAQHTASASGMVSHFIADGGELKTVRAGFTKDGRKRLSVTIEEPKDSEEKRLRREVEDLRRQLEEMTNKALNA